MKLHGINVYSFNFFPYKSADVEILSKWQHLIV